jgi:hypothetical protein
MVDVPMPRPLTLRMFACLLSMNLLGACSASDKYSGDGRLVDNGISAIAASYGTEALRAITADVSMVLIRLPGDVIFSVAGALRSWTWSRPLHGSSSFVYHREPLGSYFDASPAAEYQ